MLLDLDNPWTARLEQERRFKNISGDQARVLYELWKLLLVGDCEPSEERLRDLAGVSRSTVGRAKATGRRLGIMDWERQRDASGSLCEERPCLYRLETPSEPPQRRVRQKEERQASRSIERQLAALPVLPVGHAAMLAARQKRLDREWMERKRPVSFPLRR